MALLDRLLCPEATRGQRMSDPTREDLEARWGVLWAHGQELKERQARLTDSLAKMDEALADRALEQLQEDRKQYERDLLELRRLMKEHGGFE